IRIFPFCARQKLEDFNDAARHSEESHQHRQPLADVKPRPQKPSEEISAHGAAGDNKPQARIKSHLRPDIRLLAEAPRHTAPPSIAPTLGAPASEHAFKRAGGCSGELCLAAPKKQFAARHSSALQLTRITVPRPFAPAESAVPDKRRRRPSSPASR